MKIQTDLSCVFSLLEQVRCLAARTAQTWRLPQGADTVPNCTGLLPRLSSSVRKIRSGDRPLARHWHAAHFSCSMKVEQTWVAECTCHGIFQIHKSGSVSANAPLACVASGRLPGKKIAAMQLLTSGMT